MGNDLQNIISVIKQLKTKDKLQKYIDFIQFPFYRNIEIDTRITFEFALTVFIGQNGCGKSSCLHALYGAPDRYTPYKFWFDTKVDPVSYYDEERKRHSFWYSFKEGNHTREVIKARIKRKDDPNYWETSRPLAWAGMKTRRNRNERDKPVIKNVVYLDFRSELSAFDKYFYFGNLKHSSARNKQEFLRRKSASLNNLFKGQLAQVKSSTRVLNSPVEHLSVSELNWISFILGRQYIKGISVLHELFRNEGYSVLFQTNFAKYSEAVAGSGEMAVVRLVKEMLSAEEYSLILLDEPEVSLHPGAQNRLKLFLLEQIKLKKHQIIICTHSPSLVSDLPCESIKVFHQNPQSGRFLVKENLTPEEAFYHIEFPISSKKNIIVEDILAKEIVDSVLLNIGEEIYDLFNVKYNPGGESVVKKEFATIFCREANSMDFIFFDGDQKPDAGHFDWRNLPVKTISLQLLKQKVLEQTGESIKFSVDGNRNGGNLDQEIELNKKYLDYYLSNVFYLPRNIPEEIIWDESKAIEQIKLSIPDPNLAELKLHEISSVISTKEKFSLLAEVIFGVSDAKNISSIHRIFIKYWLANENDDYNFIKQIINTINTI